MLKQLLLLVCLFGVQIAASPLGSKANNYLEVHRNGRRMFQCQKCLRVVSTKHIVEKHLFTQHDLSPVKAVKKLYMLDDGILVPKRTLYRWKQLPNKTVSEETKTKDPCIDNDSDQHCQLSSLELSVTNMLTNDQVNGESSSDGELSDTSVDSFATTTSSEDRLQSSDSENSLCDDKVSDSTDMKALKILSCFQRHKLTASACKDILKTVKSVSAADCPNLFDYEHLLSFVPATSYREIHYCEKCERLFPENQAVYRCSTEYCPGLRYMGNLSQQEELKQPVKCFMIADIKKLLSNLLKSPGILEDLKRHKLNGDENEWTDIYSGEHYKEHQKRLSPDLLNLTGTLNTDGVNLYSSSKVELWPIFLAINELSPSLRFARQNILLVGLWQGKGKPPFKNVFLCLSQEINSILNSGLEININDDETVTVTLSVLCVTLDLPAKAGALNMTQFNGADACITCEEPGVNSPTRARPQ